MEMFESLYEKEAGFKKSKITLHFSSYNYYCAMSLSVLDLL